MNRSLVARFLAPLLLSSLLSGCASGPPTGIEPVDDFDVERYLGTWYEIARLDHGFEEGLQAVSATYSPGASEETLRVVNRGWNVEEGAWEEAEGEARLARGPGTGWLEVSFFGPFYATYAVFELDADYRHAYVTGEDRSYLWFLSRTPEVTDEELAAFRDRARAEGFDLEELIIVDHRDVPAPASDS